MAMVTPPGGAAGLAVRAALLVAVLGRSDAGLFGDNLGIGFAPCGVRHPQLLSEWHYNATSFTLEATQAPKVCDKFKCIGWCIGIDSSLSRLPPNNGSGAGVFVTKCPAYDKHSNQTDQSTFWTYNASTGKLISRFAGNKAYNSSSQELCLAYRRASGVIELGPCNSAGGWNIDPVSAQFFPAESTAREGLPEPGCLVGVNTSAGVVNSMSNVNCDSMPGSLFLYCNHTAPLEDRIANVMSFMYLDELPQDFGRLGLPHVPPTGECLHGFATACITNDTCPTIFPDALASASSFNDTLFKLIGQAIGMEGRAITNEANANVSGSANRLRGHTICWSPNLNPFRHPLWGRGQEVPSEDPLLCGRYGAAYIRGLQGVGDPAGGGFLRMVASPKHYLGYDMEGMGPGQSIGNTFSGPAYNRHNFTNRMTAQELVEFYAKPFKHAVVDGGALGMMCSYNAVEVLVHTPSGTNKSTGSIPACAFAKLQNGMARGQWNFSGYIVSDCGAISDFLTLNDCSGCSGVLPCHGWCQDANYSNQCPPCKSVCMARSMFAGGTDSSCGVTGDLIGAVLAGVVTKSELIASAQRILRVLISLGHANPLKAQPYRNLNRNDVNTAATRQLNLEAARQSIVLLKNDIMNGDRLLPLLEGQSVALMGPAADSVSILLSNYHGDVPASGAKVSHPMPSLKDALIQAGYNISYNGQGAPINLHGNPVDWVAINKSAELAAACDVAVIAVGLNAGEEHESGDRNQTGAGLGLPGAQKELIEAVIQVNPRTIVIFVHGSPIAAETVKATVPAIIDAHYPGAMGGQALTDVLTGLFNPCGRLTSTVYPKTFVNRSIFDTGLRSDGGLTYMHYSGKYGAPIWNFGDGISYSNFTVVPHSSTLLTMSTAELAEKPVTFTIAVTNEEGPAGCYSALGFIASGHSDAPRNRQLFDYSRAANLEAGHTTLLTVELTSETAGLVDGSGATRLYPGDYTVTLATATFLLTLTGSVVDVAPAPPLGLT